MTARLVEAVWGWGESQSRGAATVSSPLPFLRPFMETCTSNPKYVAPSLHDDGSSCLTNASLARTREQDGAAVSTCENFWCDHGRGGGEGTERGGTQYRGGTHD